MKAKDELAALSDELNAFTEAVDSVVKLRPSPIRDALMETLHGLMFGDEGYTLTEAGRAMLEAGK